MVMCCYFGYFFLKFKIINYVGGTRNCVSEGKYEFCINTVDTSVFTQKMEAFISFLEEKRKMCTSCTPGKHDPDTYGG